MQNKNTIIIILLAIIILILGYVAFLKPQNVNQNYSTDYKNTENNNPVSVSATLPQYMGTYQNGWPPVVTISTTPYSCVPLNGENSTVVQKIINGITYCVSNFTDAAMSHVGGDYTYTKVNGTGTKIATFKLYWPSCGAYGAPTDPTVVQCKSNQATFFAGLDALIVSLM